MPHVAVAAIAALALCAALVAAIHRDGASRSGESHGGATRKDSPTRAAAGAPLPQLPEARPSSAQKRGELESKTHSTGASLRAVAPAGGASTHAPSDSAGEDFQNPPEEAEQPTPQPKHFPRPSEQLLALMLSTPPDGVMPPLPHLDPDDEWLNADAIGAATNPIVIFEGDEEKLEALKESVADAKAQLAEIVAQGGNVADALNELRDWQNEGVAIRQETIEAINAIEDDAEAAETLEAANEELVREGIAPIRPEDVGMDEKGD